MLLAPAPVPVAASENERRGRILVAITEAPATDQGYARLATELANLMTAIEHGTHYMPAPGLYLFDVGYQQVTINTHVEYRRELSAYVQRLRRRMQGARAEYTNDGDLLTFTIHLR